jgi:glycosyltransferase involved in cell wall biosynthesis
MPDPYGGCAVTYDALFKAVSRLLACTDLRQSLGAAGRLLLEKEFTWETAWEKLDF